MRAQPKRASFLDLIDRMQIVLRLRGASREWIDEQASASARDRGLHLGPSFRSSFGLRHAGRAHDASVRDRCDARVESLDERANGRANLSGDRLHGVEGPEGASAGRAGARAPGSSKTAREIFGPATERARIGSRAGWRWPRSSPATESHNRIPGRRSQDGWPRRPPSAPRPNAAWHRSSSTHGNTSATACSCPTCRTALSLEAAHGIHIVMPGT